MRRYAVLHHVSIIVWPISTANGGNVQAAAAAGGGVPPLGLDFWAWQELYLV